MRRVALHITFLIYDRNAWQGGETFWFGLGSAVAMTDDSGVIRNKYGYEEQVTEPLHVHWEGVGLFGRAVKLQGEVLQPGGPGGS